MLNNIFSLENYLTNYSNHLLKKIIFYTFLFLFVSLTIKFFIFDKIYSKYAFEEFLINYSHGFVRRGLIGTIFLLLKREYNIDL